MWLRYFQSAAAAAPSVFTTVGLAARVPVLGKSVTSEFALADVNVSVDPEVIADVVQPVKFLNTHH